MKAGAILGGLIWVILGVSGADADGRTFSVRPGSTLQSASFSLERGRFAPYIGLDIIGQILLCPCHPRKCGRQTEGLRSEIFEVACPRSRRDLPAQVLYALLNGLRVAQDQMILRQRGNSSHSVTLG